MTDERPGEKKRSRLWWLWLVPLALFLVLLLMHNWLVVAVVAGTVLSIAVFAWSWPSRKKPSDSPETRPLRPEETPPQTDDKPARD